MRFTAQNLNRFLFLKLPSAFLCGVRVKQISAQTCAVNVRHRWISQNPFGSLYFAVQAMAAELSTGALVMYHIGESGRKVSMLVAQNKSTFSKKATGLITFTCQDGEAIAQTLAQALKTGAGQTLWMTARGTNEQGEEVALLSFEWTVKVKKSGFDLRQR